MPTATTRKNKKRVVSPEQIAIFKERMARSRAEKAAIAETGAAPPPRAEAPLSVTNGATAGAPDEVTALRQEMADLRALLAQKQRAPAEAPSAPPLTARQKKERATAADPEDVDREVARQVAAVMGTASPPPPPERTNYVVDNDPERQAALLAVQLIQEEAARAEQRRRDRPNDPREDLARELARGRTAMEIFVDAPEMPNPLAFEDPDTGKDLRIPGYVHRWVRIRNLYDDRVENQRRVREWRAWGGEVITAEDGKPLKTDTLLAMRIPMKREAQRKIAAAEPGTFGSAKALTDREVDRLNQVADDENVAYSRRYHGGSKGVVHLQPAPGHGIHYGRADEGDDE